MPVAVEVKSPTEQAPRVLADLRGAIPHPNPLPKGEGTVEASFPVVDALAARDAAGSLLVSVVYRGTSGPIELAVQLDGVKPAATAEVTSLSADVPWAANSLEEPEAVKPVHSQTPVRDGRLSLRVKPYTVLRIKIGNAKSEIRNITQ